MKKRILSLLLLFPAFSFSQTEVGGRVWDGDKHPLSLVNVALLSAKDSAVITGAVTDSVGAYLLKFVPRGENRYLLNCSSVGYQSKTISLKLTDSLRYIRNVMLDKSATSLDEVVVTASRNPFSMTKEGLMADVEHSILQNELQPVDLLSKIPGLVREGDQIRVFGKGAPVYYINDRKVYDFSEVERLPVKDICSVCLVTSPGAKYDSGGKAVILITVKRIRDGIMIQANVNGSQGECFSHGESLNLNYKTDKLNLFTSYRYGDSRMRREGESGLMIMADTVWNKRGEWDGNSRSRLHSWQIGFDYDLSKESSFGARYNGTVSKPFSRNVGYSAYLADEIPFVDLTSLDHTTGSDGNHHLNFYYKKKWKEKWKFNVFADYIRRTGSQNGTIFESDSQLDDKEVYTIGNSGWNVYAMNASLVYDAGKAGTISLGTNISHVDGFNKVVNINTLNNGETQSRENKQALYLSYDYSLGDFSLNAGLRFEALSTRSKDLLNLTGEIKHNYRDLFPSVTLSHQKGSLGQSFSYTLRTERPPYDLINNNSYYAGRFNRIKGNIDLKQSVDHELSYSLFYKIVYLNVSYAHSRNNIMDNLYAEDGNSSVVVQTAENYKKYRELRAIVNLRKDFKWWIPSLTLSCIKTFFSYPTFEGEKHAKTPWFTVNWNNYLRLPKGFLVSFDLTHNFRGEYQRIESYASTTLNVSVQKYFLNNRLQITLQGYDLFRGDRVKYKACYNNVIEFSHSVKDSRKVGLSITYRFNQYTKKYRGESAAEEEIGRLKPVE